MTLQVLQLCTCRLSSLVMSRCFRRASWTPRTILSCSVEFIEIAGFDNHPDDCFKCLTVMEHKSLIKLVDLPNCQIWPRFQPPITDLSTNVSFLVLLVCTVVVCLSYCQTCASFHSNFVAICKALHRHDKRITLADCINRINEYKPCSERRSSS